MKNFTFVFVNIAFFTLFALMNSVMAISGETIVTKSFTVSDSTNVDYDSLYISYLQSTSQSDYQDNQSSDAFNKMSYNNDITGIILGISFFVCVALVVFFCLFFKLKNKQAKYRVIEKAIDSGQEIPKNLFQKENKKINTSKLEESIICICIGIALLICSLLINNHILLIIPGIIIEMVGIGLITTETIRRRDVKQNQNNIESDK